MLELNPINSVVCNSHVYQMVSVIDSKLCYNATLVTLFFFTPNAHSAARNTEDKGQKSRKGTWKENPLQSSSSKVRCAD